MTNEQRAGVEAGEVPVDQWRCPACGGKEDGTRSHEVICGFTPPVDETRCGAQTSGSYSDGYATYECERDRGHTGPHHQSSPYCDWTDSSTTPEAAPPTPQEAVCATCGRDYAGAPLPVECIDYDDMGAELSRHLSRLTPAPRQEEAAGEESLAFMRGAFKTMTGQRDAAATRAEKAEAEVERLRGHNSALVRAVIRAKLDFDYIYRTCHSSSGLRGEDAADEAMMRADEGSKRAGRALTTPTAEEQS